MLYIRKYSVDTTTRANTALPFVAVVVQGINSAAQEMLNPNFMKDAMEMMKDPAVMKQVGLAFVGKSAAGFSEAETYSTIAQYRPCRHKEFRNIAQSQPHFLFSPRTFWSCPTIAY